MAVEGRKCWIWTRELVAMDEERSCCAEAEAAALEERRSERAVRIEVEPAKDMAWRC